MDRRWIRIDRAHQTFDCSSADFEVLLAKAREEVSPSDQTDQALVASSLSANDLFSRNSELQEAINAELALLASLQRRERFSRRECEQSDREHRLSQQGQSLAELHSVMLQLHRIDDLSLESP